MVGKIASAKEENEDPREREVGLSISDSSSHGCSMTSELANSYQRRCELHNTLSCSYKQQQGQDQEEQ